MKYFWESWSNCADVALMILCLLTLWWLPLAGWEQSLDAFVLLLRNGLQALRIFTAIHHHGRARQQSRPEVFIDLEHQ